MARVKVDLERQKALQQFTEYLVKENGYTLEFFFEKSNASDAEELSAALVYIFDVHDSIHHLISAIIKKIPQIVQSDKESINQFLRGNDLTTCLITKILQVYGESYLKHIVRPVLQKLAERKVVVEIDQSKLSSTDSLQTNLENLLNSTNSVLKVVWDNVQDLPPVVRELLIQTFAELNGRITAEKFIGSFFFLRFLGPAIVIPSFKDKKLVMESRRTMILIAKLIQLIGNQITEFEASDIMNPAKAYIKEQLPNLKKFATSVLDSTHKSYRKKIRTKSSRYVDASSIHLFDWINSHVEDVESIAQRICGYSAIDDLRQAMQKVRIAYGNEPSRADDYQKVWKRVQSQLNRPNLKTVDRSLSLGSVSDTIPTYSSSLSSETSSTLSDDQYLISTSTTEEDIRMRMFESDKPLIFKCFDKKEKKMKLILGYEEISFPELLSSIHSKFGLVEDQACRISFNQFTLKEIGSDVQQNPSFITDDTTFHTFLENGLNDNGACSMYELFIES